MRTEVKMGNKREPTSGTSKEKEKERRSSAERLITGTRNRGIGWNILTEGQAETKLLKKKKIKKCEILVAKIFSTLVNPHSPPSCEPNVPFHPFL